MATKRLTAAQRREARDRLDARHKLSFMSKLGRATTRDELDRLANDGSTTNNGPGAGYHRWLGCALHGNPYDTAPADVREAIAVAMARAKGGA